MHDQVMTVERLRMDCSMRFVLTIDTVGKLDEDVTLCPAEKNVNCDVNDEQLVHDVGNVYTCPSATAADALVHDDPHPF